MRKLAILPMMAASALSVAATPSLDELYKTIQKQQQEIEALKASASQQEERLNMTADALGNTAASKTTLGGYGELHYNDLNGENGADDKNAIDFHRFVLFVGHQFDEKTRFFSEVEIEHSLAGDGKPGEVELEQAYVERDLNDQHKAKAGLFLMPVGLLNETHEPETFYGVERNNVEKNIVPSTWWEAGLAFNGQFADGFSYDVALTSGLNIKVTDGKYKIRDGRQKVAKAKADDLAFTTRIKYTGVKGLEVALTAQRQNDVTQSVLSDDKIAATLIETHVAYQVNGFGLRALYAKWDLDEKMNDYAAGAAEQSGWYIEPSYRIDENWGVFTRVSEWDNQADDNNETAIQQYDVGFNYWVHPQVVLKFDYQDQRHESDNGPEQDGFNLGVGFSF